MTVLHRDGQRAFGRCVQESLKLLEECGGPTTKFVSRAKILEGHL
jgi:hypothetical protein